MRSSILILSLLSLFAFQQNIEIINWSAKKLAWADFKGKHSSTSTLDAYTAYEVSFTPKFNATSDSILITVACAFNKNKSTVRKGKANDSLLIHEQGHFDIAEAQSRLFRKKLASAVFTLKNMQSILDIAYKTCITQLDNEQKLYDIETNHSMDRNKQVFWTKKIEEELKQNEKFNISMQRFKLGQ